MTEYRIPVFLDQPIAEVPPRPAPRRVPSADTYETVSKRIDDMSGHLAAYRAQRANLLRQAQQLREQARQLEIRAEEIGVFMQDIGRVRNVLYQKRLRLRPLTEGEQ